MKLRHLRITNFRSIRSLDWPVGGDFLCLVGAGDSGKSTILDAIELVLSPRWNPLFDDGDFHGVATTEPILIEATLGSLPDRLLSDGQFGLRLRGLSPSGKINDEPLEGDEEVITVRLTVDASLEPVWEVVTDRHPEGAPIHARERERFGVVRLGATVDRHLSWSRGSVLARLTGETDEHADLLAEAARSARVSVDAQRMPKLAEAATQAAALASAFGVRPVSAFRPGLDPSVATVGAGGLSLHDGAVPLRRAGLGTRRLVALATQREVAREGGVVLVDEVEHGLEPFRVRRLLRELLEPSASKTAGAASGRTAPKGKAALVVLTSHSPVVVGELSAAHLRVVRRSSEATKVLQVPESLQAAFRVNPEAFLSRRVVVCEGKTELGLLRGLDESWAMTGEPFAAAGTALADGGGSSKVGSAALVFADLLYPTAILADDDVPLDVDRGVLEGRGIVVVQWAGRMTVEQRVFADLPWEGVVDAVDAAMREHGEERIRAQFATALRASTNDIPEDVATWTTWRASADVRAALGVAAKAKGGEWYKRVDRGAALGRIVAGHLHVIAESDLATKILGLKKWIFSPLMQPDVLATAARASVIAAAGCGKTELIARVVGESAGRQLVLTHTNAGVDAIRRRLRRLGTAAAKANVDTVDGWCLKFVASYPVLSGGVPLMEDGRINWPALRSRMRDLLHRPLIQKIVTCSYDGVLVDEYQDCGVDQHGLVISFASFRPVRILGDPMQAVFGWAEPLADWEDIRGAFPVVGELTTPWRWRNPGSNAGLGEWLAETRGIIAAEGTIDLLDARVEVVVLADPKRWQDAAQEVCVAVSKRPGSLAAISKWSGDCHTIAMMTGGLFQCVEPIETKAGVQMLANLEAAAVRDRPAVLVNFMKEVAVHLEAHLVPLRAAAFQGEQPRESIASVFSRLVAVREGGGAEACVGLLEALAPLDGVRVFRRELLWAVMDTLRDVGTAPMKNLVAAFRSRRNLTSHVGRRLARCSVGTTLLLKGMEFDHVVVVHTGGDRGFGAKDLYVALTRGAKSLTVLAPSGRIDVRSLPGPGALRGP